MKQTRQFAFMALTSIAAFCAVVYSSCTKNKCSGVVCQNGGSCSGGNCSCPAGYSGNRCELSSIVYQNNTFTPVDISVNGTTGTIPVGSTLTFTGTSGSNAVVSASTSGLTTAGTQVGDMITWGFTDVFPSNGDGLNEPFDVDSKYFYLKVINNNVSDNINSIYVNYGTSEQTQDNISIPNDRNTYGIGYYLAYDNTVVYATSTSGGHWSWTPSIPNILDATQTVTAY